MNDPIDRRAAIDALDEQIKFCDNALCDFNISLKDEYAVKVEKASLCAYKEILEDLPSAQAEIIHCGECKYYHDSDGCFFSTATTGANGFCHWAERKEGEADALD